MFSLLLKKHCVSDNISPETAWKLLMLYIFLIGSGLDWFLFYLKKCCGALTENFEHFIRQVAK